MSIKIVDFEDILKYLEYKKQIELRIQQIKNNKREEVAELEVQEEIEEYKIEQLKKETNRSYTLKHDKLFRDILNNKEEVILFIKNFLDTNSKLKPEDIEKYNRTFITKEYKERQSDIIYKLKNKNIFIIIEHQSKIDYSMPFRFEEYGFETRKSAIDRNKLKNKNYKLPKIIPILLYTGEKEWKVSDELVEEEYTVFEEFGLQLKYNIVDINNYEKERLQKMDSIVASAMLIEKIKSDEEIIEIVKRLIKQSTTEERKELSTNIVTNILKETLERINDNLFEKIIKEINKRKEGENMRPLDERIQEGNAQIRKQIYQEGERRGEKRGRIAGIIEIAKNMIRAKFESDTISKMTGLTEEELNKIAKEMNKNYMLLETLISMSL